MKLYYHPVSTTSRPILQFCAENNIAYEPHIVDLMTGAHHQEPYISINPNRLVPCIDDDGFVLTESSAILKYLAEKHNSPAYPRDLKQRARINEVMDWFNTNFYREFGYNMVYPQLFPHHTRKSPEANKGTVDWGKDKTQACLEILDKHMLGAKKDYLCGDTITIADYFGAALVTLGEIIGANFSRYPNVQRWLTKMKARPAWDTVNEAHNGFVAAMQHKAPSFTSLS